jgi:hypothetical protein
LREQERIREARLAEANRLAGTGPARPRVSPKPPNAIRADATASVPERPLPPVAAEEHPKEDAPDIA